LLRGKDECGRRCQDNFDIDTYGAGNNGNLSYNFYGGTITLGSYPADPTGLWGYQVRYKNEVLEQGFMEPGSTKDVSRNLFDEIAPGSRYKLEVTFDRNGMSVTAEDWVECGNLCAKDSVCSSPCEETEPLPVYQCSAANLSDVDEGYGSTYVMIPTGFQDAGQNKMCYIKRPADPLPVYSCTVLAMADVDQGFGSSQYQIPDGYQNAGSYITCYFTYNQES
jgi:hypothetical protein